MNPWRNGSLDDENYSAGVMRYVAFSRRAETDFHEILVYIAQDNEEAAYRLKDAIMETTRELLIYPQSAYLIVCGK